MNILMFAHAFPPTFGGVETHLWDISQNLTRRGHRVACLVGGEETRETMQGIAVTRHPALTVQNLIARRRGLGPDQPDGPLLDLVTALFRSAIDAFAPDVVHAHNAHHFAPEPAWAALATAGGRVTLNSVHDRVGEHLYPYILDLPWHRVLYASRYLAASMPSTRPTTVDHLGIDLAGFSGSGEVDERFAALERPIIFHPARLLRWKGPDVGVRAFALIRERLGRGTLVLCSSEAIVDDPAEVRALKAELQEMSRRAGIADNVVFLSFARSRIADAYRASDLIWYPTVDDEPFGLVPLEAMACGVPLVVSRSGGMCETVTGDNGLIVAKSDPAALAEAALRILRDSTLRDRLVAAGRRDVAKFDVVDYVARLEALYQC